MATSAPNTDAPVRLTDKLWFNVAVPVVVTIAVNGVIFLSGWNETSDVGAPDSALPPGPIVGLIWVALIALTGLSRWLYVIDTGRRDVRSWMPWAIAAACIAYPFYTDGLSADGPALTGTLITLAFTALVMFALSPLSKRAANAMLPLAVWLGYVSVITLFG